LLVRPNESWLTGSTPQLLQVREKNERVSEDDVEHLVDLYDASILQLDETLLELQEMFEAEGLMESTIILVTSDHGEEFFEHGGATSRQDAIRRTDPCSDDHAGAGNSGR
jgi:arylsulfatase A-like enzyme